MTLFDAPTLRLLNSSSVVAISGGLRLHVAFLLAGIPPRIPEYIAFSLIVYATYTLDRTLDCKEDALNRNDLTGADRKCGLRACIISFLIGTGVFISAGMFIVPFIPFIIGYLYTHGIQVNSVTIRFKAGIGIKNAVIGLTWGGSIALIVLSCCSNSITGLVIFLFFFLKVFITSCVNDIKDIPGDMAAGIQTLPVKLGESLTRRFLIVLLLFSYLILIFALVNAFIQNEWILIAVGFFLMFIFLIIYRPSFEKRSQPFFRKMREFAISWESVIGLTMRACVPA